LQPAALLHWAARQHWWEQQQPFLNGASLPFPACSVACKHKQEQQTREGFVGSWRAAVAEAGDALKALADGGGGETEAAEWDKRAVQVGGRKGALCD
jgi:hypothetical protein